MSRPRVLLLFLDGVGIGPDDPLRNPFLRARLPTLSTLVGGIPTLEEPRPRTGGAAIVVPLDATLGMEGTPQSGTGQTTLLTGVNAAERFGGHFGPWTPVRLRPLLEETSLLRRALDGGHETAFANAYPRSWPGERSARRVAAPPLAARAAGLLVRHEEALAAGNAVSSEIVNDGWRRHLGHLHLPVVTAEAAGRTLAAIAARHRLTLYAHYATDLAGHRGGMEGAVAALERVDAFLGGLMEALPDDVVLVVASDHGNVEDVTGGHTRNPVLGLLAGPGAARRAQELASIQDVAPALLRWLEE
ncbi:MAG: alkaline phosphatase family protein [Gemmatimonadetes bacterium]|nr:alkaline phosphatase family protein [Gemmatimonadota bacterium]